MSAAIHPTTPPLGPCPCPCPCRGPAPALHSTGVVDDYRTVRRTSRRVKALCQRKLRDLALELENIAASEKSCAIPFSSPPPPFDRLPQPPGPLSWPMGELAEVAAKPP